MTRLLVIMSILLVLASPMARSHENSISLFDGESVITIVESSVHEAPRTNSIQASINGHALSVVFTENLGTVHVEVTDTSGGPVDLTDMYTPNGYNAYIHHAGSYVVTFTLGNGDEYYGEFDVVE